MVSYNYKVNKEVVMKATLIGFSKKAKRKNTWNNV